MEKKIDLVYILGDGSRWSNNELRYSIRSAVKHFKFDNIFIVGVYPDWLEGAIHIDVKDEFTNKLLNAKQKYLAACNDDRISEDFVLMNDDFFFLKDIEDIPYYSRGPIEEQVRKHKTHNGYYFVALKDTEEKLKDMGINHELMDFEEHMPIVFNKEKLKQAIITAGNKPYVFRTVYGNMFAADNYVVTSDCKAVNIREMYDIIKESPLLSITDSMVFSREFRSWIKDRFPAASKYENDNGDGEDVAPNTTRPYQQYHATQSFEYGGQNFRKGQLIDMRTMKAIKKTNNLRHLWILK